VCTSPRLSPDHPFTKRAYLVPAWAEPPAVAACIYQLINHFTWQLLLNRPLLAVAPTARLLHAHSCFVLLFAPGRKLRQQGGVCGAFASASATAVSTGGTATAQSQAVAQSICNGLRNNDGTSIAQAISTASSTGNAETVAQAIAEAASGGKTQIAAWLQTLEE
jgi:hypothetical protein